jgi:fluoride ion exporter CrcB/FEX
MNVVPLYRGVADGGDIVAVIALGGALGATVRRLISEAFPHATRGVPFGTFMVNLSGCLLIGLLMVSIVEVWRPHRFPIYLIDARQPTRLSMPSSH